MEWGGGGGGGKGSVETNQQQQQVSTPSPPSYPTSLLHLTQPKSHTTSHDRTKQRPHHFKTEEEYNGFLRVAQESIAMGRETLTAVAGQQESLDRAEAVVDSNRYLIDKSARSLRGMSWWGSVKNFFSEEPAAPRPKASSWMTKQQQQQPQQQEEATGRSSIPTSSSISSRNSMAAQWQDQPQGYTQSSSDERQELYSLRHEGNATDARATRSQAGSAPPATLARVAHIQDTYLEKLSKSVDEQRAIGGTLHEALSEQAAQINRLGESSEGLHDRTRAVVRKAARVSRSQGGWGGERPKLHKFIAFRELRTGLFLSVVGEELKLQEPHMTKACQFAAYTCQTALTGLQSVLSRKWLGQHWITGALGVRGTGLGKNEEWEVDWGKPGGAFLLSCSANWGNGGYLMLVPGKEGGRGGGEGRGQDVRLGGYGVEERGKAALFELMDCETYRTTEVVTEIMHKKTPAELAAEEELRNRQGVLGGWRTAALKGSRG